MISASCHSDDRRVEVSFDATFWFQQASDQELTDLAECSFRGDYASDAVAIFMAGKNKKGAGMFTHIEIMGQRESMGFECNVNANEAMDWSRRRHPHLIEEWKTNEDVEMEL